MAQFESYERREPQILAKLKEYGISSIEECKEICEKAGIDVYHLIEGIGDDGRQFTQVDTVQRYRQVLQHRGVLILCVDLHARTVVGDEVYLRLYLLAFGEEDIVVAVQVEFLVAQCRTKACASGCCLTVRHWDTRSST